MNATEHFNASADKSQIVLLLPAFVGAVHLVEKVHFVTFWWVLENKNILVVGV